MEPEWRTSEAVYDALAIPAIRDLGENPASYDLPAIMNELVMFDRHDLVFRRVASDDELRDVVKRHPKRASSEATHGAFSEGIWPSAD